MKLFLLTMVLACIATAQDVDRKFQGPTLPARPKHGMLPLQEDPEAAVKGLKFVGLLSTETIPEAVMDTVGLALIKGRVPVKHAEDGDAHLLLQMSKMALPHEDLYVMTLELRMPMQREDGYWCSGQVWSSQTIVYSPTGQYPSERIKESAVFLTEQFAVLWHKVGNPKD